MDTLSPPAFDKAKIMDLLQEVMDPEIPVVSLVELGVVHEVKQLADGTVHIEMVPTFAGCPAIGFMRLNVEEVLKREGYAKVQVEINYNRPWTSNLISEKGKKLLKAYGLSPPPAYDGELSLETLAQAECPHCGSKNTKLVSPFGPTLCRAIHKCHDCHETFEQFKPV